jgi:hypothetical protein
MRLSRKFCTGAFNLKKPKRKDRAYAVVSQGLEKKTERIFSMVHERLICLCLSASVNVSAGWAKERKDGGAGSQSDTCGNQRL